MQRLLAVLILVTVALAGCTGSTASDEDPAQPQGDDPGTADDGPAAGDDNASTPSGDDGSTDPGPEDDGPRTPDDAMAVAPVETGEGWAHYQLDRSTTFALNAFYANIDSDVYRHNLTLQGDETLVEVLISWESEQMDMNMLVLNEDGKTMDNSAHGQVFINQFCGLIGECIFVFPPNGTTWEYINFGAELIEEGRTGQWTIHIEERNNWEAGHVQQQATGDGGIPYTLDVWVHTVPAEPTQHPERGG